MLNAVRHLFLVTESLIIYKWYTRDPVTIPDISCTLDIVLFTGKIPHEITPVHETILISKEPAEVVAIAWNFNGKLFAGPNHLATSYAYGVVVINRIGLGFPFPVLRYYLSIACICNDGLFRCSDHWQVQP